MEGPYCPSESSDRLLPRIRTHARLRSPRPPHPPALLARPSPLTLSPCGGRRSNNDITGAAEADLRAALSHINIQNLRIS